MATVPQSAGERAAAVLRVARQLLAVGEQGRPDHGVIARAFYARFIRPGFPLTFAVRAAEDAPFVAFEALHPKYQVWVGPDASDTAINLYLWSALHTDDALKEIITEVAERRGRARPRAAQPRARLIDGSPRDPLPRIEITFPKRALPSPDRFVHWYRADPWQRWKDRLWDGSADLERTKLPSQASLIRGWALYSLAVYADLPVLRHAVAAWNDAMPEMVRLEIGCGPLVKREDQASRERTRAHQAAERLDNLLRDIDG